MYFAVLVNDLYNTSQFLDTFDTLAFLVGIEFFQPVRQRQFLPRGFALDSGSGIGNLDDTLRFYGLDCLTGGAVLLPDPRVDFRQVVHLQELITPFAVDVNVKVI